MLARFSLAILFAVLVAASRPLATGGRHDLMAVGVRVEETVDGKPVQRLSLGMPGGAVLEAYETLLRSPASQALVQGTTVYAPAPGEGPGPRIVELVYYGRGSRAGRSPVVFSGKAAAEIPGAAEAYAAARSLASLPGPVTSAAARVLLRTTDDAAYRDALEALAAVQADAASGECLRTAKDREAPVTRRILAVQALKRLGGPRIYPDDFRSLAEDPDPMVRDAAGGGDVRR